MLTTEHKLNTRMLLTKLKPGSQKYLSSIFNKFVESKTRAYHGRDGSKRTAERRGRAGQDGAPTAQVAHTTRVPLSPQGIEDTSPERRPRSKIKQNPM